MVRQRSEDGPPRPHNRAASCAGMSALAAVLALLSAPTILAYAGTPLLAVPAALIAIGLGTVALLWPDVRRSTERGAVLATVSVAVGMEVHTRLYPTVGARCTVQPNVKPSDKAPTMRHSKKWR